MRVRKDIILMCCFLCVVFSNCSAQNTATTPKISAKCPKCAAEKWHYTRDGWVETFTNPDFKGKLYFDWATMSVKNERGDTTQFTFFTNEKDQSQTVLFWGFTMKNYYNSKADYVGTEFK